MFPERVWHVKPPNSPSVMPEGLRCLVAVSEKYGFHWNFQHFDFASCDYYDKHGKMLPEDWVEILKPFDAIYFGAVGDPRRAPVSLMGYRLAHIWLFPADSCTKDHITLWGSLLQASTLIYPQLFFLILDAASQFRRQFDQYVNLRPVRLIPGVQSPLALRNPGSEKM